MNQYLKSQSIRVDKPIVRCFNYNNSLIAAMCQLPTICLRAVLLITFFLATIPSWAAEKNVAVSFSGPCYFRLPGFHSFVFQDGADSVPEGTLVTVRPDVQNPVASESRLMVGSYTVTLLPGATFKAMRRGFVPLSGRFLFDGEGNEALIFTTRSFELHYKRGRLLLEITPDDGTFIALRNKGDVFVKALNRHIYDLAAGNELHFPLFGAAKLKKRLSGFWDDPPTGFSSARRRPELASSSDDEDDDADEDAESVSDNKDREKVTESDVASVSREIATDEEGYKDAQLSGAPDVDAANHDVSEEKSAETED